MVALENKEEVGHIISVLKKAKEALKSGNSYVLQDLSDQTIHSASVYQHTDLITLAVVIYSLNKMVAKKEKLKIPGWDSFVKKICDEIDKGIAELEKSDAEEFARHMEHAKSLMSKVSPNVRPNIEDVLKKASINKAGKIYEHGISLEQTAKLLGVSQWDLLEYIGEKNMNESFKEIIDVKKRAKMALEFFS